MHVGEQRSVGNLANDVGVPLQAHEEGALAQRCDHVTFVASAFGRGHGDLPIINRRA